MELPAQEALRRQSPMAFSGLFKDLAAIRRKVSPCLACMEAQAPADQIMALHRGPLQPVPQALLTHMDVHQTATPTGNLCQTPIPMDSLHKQMSAEVVAP